VKTAVKHFDVYQGPFIAISFSDKGHYIKDGRNLSAWNAEV